MPERLVIGSRASRLALVQTESVVERLKAAWPGLEVRVEPIRTSGDRDRRTPLGRAAGVGFFVRELERALLDGRIGLAVHSMKDVPTRLAEGLEVEAAVPGRADARDCLVTPAGLTVQALPRGARIGTGSPRRRAMLRAARPDLAMTDLRGNVETRLAKLSAGECDGTILARAGLERLEGGVWGLGSGVWGTAPPSARRPLVPRPETPDPAVPVVLGTDQMLPAAGQGALGLEFRADDGRVRQLIGPLDDPAARAAVTAERALVRRLGAGCHTPLGVLGRADDAGRLTLEAWLLAPEGSPSVRREARGEAAEAAALGVRLAEEVLAAGGAAILR